MFKSVFVSLFLSAVATATSAWEHAVDSEGSPYAYVKPVIQGSTEAPSQLTITCRSGTPVLLLSSMLYKHPSHLKTVQVIVNYDMKVRRVYHLENKSSLETVAKFRSDDLKEVLLMGRLSQTFIVQWGPLDFPHKSVFSGLRSDLSLEGC